MKKLKVLVTIGTRPNFIKVTQFKKVSKDFSNLEIKILHTGQHYDFKMAKVFFEQFGMEPDFFLEVGKGTPNEQIGKIIIEFDRFIKESYKPDIVLVPGDVNSTAAIAIAANKLGIPVGHIESGLRSFDRTMPEELNRLIVDELSDIFFVTEPSGIENLKKEQKKGEVHFVGNTMIDTMVAFEKDIDNSSIIENLKLKKSKYCLFTFHRPAMVDELAGLNFILDLFLKIPNELKGVFPMHPRTKRNIEKYKLWRDFEGLSNIVLMDPIGYFEFQKLIKHATLIITDSGGIQEETTFRKVPCITIRPNTERPVTVKEGSNKLFDQNIDLIQLEINNILNGNVSESVIPNFWEGKATNRILEVLSKWQIRNSI